jgi:outer membrane protein assembly factor BamB
MRVDSKSLIVTATLAVMAVSCGERYTGPFRDPNIPVIPSFADSAFGAGGSKWFASRTFDTITAAAIDAQSLFSAEFVQGSGASLVAISLTNGALRWTKAIPSSGDIVAMPGVAAAVSSSVAAFDATTGAVKFTYQPLTARLVTSNGATDGTHIMVGNASGEVVALHPSSGAEVWKLQVDTAAVRGISAGGGVVFAGGNGFLAALNATTGALLWKRVVTETPRPNPITAPAVDNGRVTARTLAGTTAGMANYNATTGVFQWSVPGSVPTSNLEVPGQSACDGIVASGGASTIAALSSTTGQPVWTRSIGAYVAHSASCSHGAVISSARFGIPGAFRNEVQVLRASDGTLLAQYPKTAGQQLRVHRVLRTTSTLYFLTDKGVTAITAP